jgi:DUF1680 family protein
MARPRSRSRILVPAALVAAACAASADAAYPVRPVPFTDVTLTAGMLQERQQVNRKVTVPFALDQCQSSKRMDNFDLAAETMKRRAAGEKTFQHKPATGAPYDDSDVFKALEGASYCLTLEADAGLRKRVDEFIARIAAAQEPDGYLYTFRTMHPDAPVDKRMHAERWLKDPGQSHELYNLGHLFEAGVAHAQATGSDALLAVCLEAAELLHKEFADGDPRIPPGHQGIEMALVKLHEKTGDPRWLDLAKLFLDARGGGSPYNQNHEPVVAQREAVGHAVRANYMYGGMADVAALKGEPRYLEAITAIWNDVVGRKMHLTGGCGAHGGGETYGGAYELPHKCYNETCAAIAFMYWNQRMFLMTGDGKYMDVFERTLYNNFLSGVSLSGDRFFYPNPLEWDGKEKFNHGHAGRAPWFGCACCPPNVVRTMAALGGAAYAVQDERLFVNLYASNDAKVKVGDGEVKLALRTGYPWTESVAIEVQPKQAANFTLCLRIPGWVLGRPVPGDLYTYADATPAAWAVTVNGAKAEAALENGFARIARTWQPGDRVELTLPMPVRRVLANDKVEAARGQVALERGPAVFCFEGLDNGGSVSGLALPDDAAVTAGFAPALLGGVTVLEVAGAQRVRPGAGAGTTAAVAIPYAVWNNRGPTPMRVWLASDAAQVQPAAAAASAEWQPVPGNIMSRWAKDVTPQKVLPEYPRPQLVRKEWQNLNGPWQFAVTTIGRAAPVEYSGTILVPFCIESALSGVKQPLTAEQCLWYRRTFAAPARRDGERLLLHFGSVDWHAKVFVNGKSVGEHTGGFDPFTFDVSDAVKPGADNELVVAVTDATGGAQARGKQKIDVIAKPKGIRYTPCSGIWQTVWMETVPADSISALMIVPDVDAGRVVVTVTPRGAAGRPVKATARDGDRVVATAEGVAGKPLVLAIKDARLWSPDSPFLYDLAVTYGSDTVTSYFGMRKVSVGKDEKGVPRFFLNNQPLFHAGFLDQGYWPDGIFTAPTDEALRFDIEFTKKLGMNMARKHVKVEPARWYYWCDKLGLLVWQDMPSGGPGPGSVGSGAGRDKETGEMRDGKPVSPEAAAQFAAELQAMVRGLWNHPSIVMWVVFNEGWGQFDTPRLTKMVKALDPSRLVNNASGGHDIPAGDVMDAHLYPGPGCPKPNDGRVAVCGEFGGLGLPIEGHTWVARTWGYHTAASTDELTARYVGLIRRAWELKDQEGMAAFVYTQTTDVETECNGAITYDREIIKVDPEKAAAANRGEFPAP